MNNQVFHDLQIREVFHIEFLRNFSRKVKPTFYSLKGGVNLRLYFKSIRYSEDMDLDINTVGVNELGEITMRILTSPIFQNELKAFGIGKIVPPNMSKAKQKETTQRFKIHLITDRNEDFFTKIEFSRRRSSAKSIVEPIPDGILRMYRMSPLIISHYGIKTAIEQKINALVQRSMVQARDIFDLYILSPQYSPDKDGKLVIDGNTGKTACDNLLPVSFHQFRDSVLSFFSDDDKTVYHDERIWDEIKLKVGDLICQNQQ